MFVKAEAVYGFPFELIHRTTGASITSGAVTGYYLKDGGAQTALTGAATHEGNGQWSWDTIPATAMDGTVIGLLFVHADGSASFTIQTTTAPYGELVAGTPSEVALVNQALSDLGDDPITSLLDDTERAKLCRRLFAQCRDELLDEIRPACAIRRSLLAATTTPTFGWTYAFQLPTNCLRPLETDDDTTAWQQEADTLVTSRTPVYLKYLYRQEDVSKYPPAFTRALVAYLTARLTYAITKNAALKEQNYKLYDIAKYEALTLDGQVGTASSAGNTVLTTQVRS